MKEYVKAYNMFLPGRYMKIILYLLMPVVIIGISVFVGTAWIPEEMRIPLACLYIFWGEILLEGWTFRGIGKKNNKNLEYIKTSAKWKRLLYKGLIFDSVRRFFSAAFILGVTYMFVQKRGGMPEEGNIFTVLIAIFSTCFWCMVLMSITRHTDNTYVSFAVMYFAFFPFFIVNEILMTHMANLPGVVAGMALFVIAVACNIFPVMKRIGGSFYDE